jgi:hypothetical protein
MPLKMSYFSFVGVNWEPKPGNLIVAAKNLNVGIDSFVFVDDNPHERAQMKAHLPSVMVAEGMDEWISSKMRGLAQELGSTYFADIGKTQEDILRAQRSSQVDGGALLDAAFSKKEYLETLENNPDKWCNMFTVDECRESGYEAISSSFEHGLYGRVANPKSILENWLKLYPDDKFIFVRTDENPFACEFILMKKINKNEEV